jgi:hypothetical protein
MTPSSTVAKKAHLMGGLLALVLMVASSATANDKEIAAINERLDELEAITEGNTAFVEDVETGLDRLLKVSGYTDAEFIVSDIEGENSRFRMHHFSMFLESRISDEIKVFTEIEYEDAPSLEFTPDGTPKATEGKILVEQVYTDFSPRPNITIRVGRYLTPAGIWLIHHYPPFVPTQGRPLHIRKIFPQYLDGIEVIGSAELGFQVLGLEAYVSNGEGNSGNGDLNDQKAFGGRLSTTFPSLFDMRIGLSGYSDTLNDDTAKNAYGVDLQARVAMVRIQAEYATAALEPSGGASYNATGYYAQGTVDISDFSVTYRYDFYEASDIIDGDAATVHTGAVNYHLSPVAVLKLELNSYLFENADNDYNEVIVSSAISF